MLWVRELVEAKIIEHFSQPFICFPYSDLKSSI